MAHEHEGNMVNEFPVSEWKEYWESLINENTAFRARVARLEEALKFYAEKDYIEWVTKGSPDEDCYEDVDKGAVARRALEE